MDRKTMGNPSVLFVKFTYRKIVAAPYLLGQLFSFFVEIVRQTYYRVLRETSDGFFDSSRSSGQIRFGGISRLYIKDVGKT